MSQESGRHDDVGTPARHGQHHCSHGPDLQGVELAAQPSSVSDARGVKGHEEDHGGQNQICLPPDGSPLDNGQVLVHGDIGEGDGGDDEEEAHELHGTEQDSSSTDSIDGDEVDKGEEEVDTGDDGSDGDWVAKANLGERKVSVP